MREIKFRVFNGIQMVYDVMAGRFGNFYVNPDNNGISNEDSSVLTPFNTKYPDAVDVMQFAGLKDRYGKDIYEGDIIDHYATFGVVLFEDGMFTLSSSANKNFPDHKQPLCYLGEDHMTVLGNVYENKELLNHDK
jgi:uncharacterized phage protein (TIGR01671 family)